ncbi:MULTISPECIES: DUF1254 domain-containing protein [unclassified Sphingopyxis]|jgi:uncharacterized membrane protein|uniref:DUF1254 domain-containing protein n=1 Tax=unclassified Sphingopyxis TaxID=2614943 RepID=UPI002859A572|nr:MULTISPECIES: DUF1254 domain-containing protein [unclassified Sphingopyxis]MDR6831885.1 putative membrane protein [Sphingopyxis sp. BE122]MDR7227627.1 putative membrane protein [Sphingopyxis sp. BE259]
MRNGFGPLAFGLVVAAATTAAAVGYAPYGLMNIAMERLGQGGVNRMSYGNLATPERQPVVRPSPDLAYSSCPYDLSAGPLAIDVTPVPGRYSSLSVFDAATDVIFVRNDVEAAGKPYRIIVARAGQAVPKGAEVVHTDHDRGIALIRLLLKDPAEIGGLDAVRRQSSCATVTKLK